MEASTKAQLTMDIVHVEGRTIEGVKVEGLLPEAYYDNGADFNIYVRWEADSVRATRSDTDEVIGIEGECAVQVTITKAGKFAAFAELMQALANHYGLTVVVQADPGIKGAHALKLVGTWAPDVIEIDTTGTECLCDEIFAQRKAGKVPPIGGLYCPGDGSIFTREGTEASDDVIEASAIVIERNQAAIHSRDYVTEEEIIAIGLDKHCSNGRCGTCVACTLAMARHLVADPFGAKVTVGGFDNAGTADFPVAATIERKAPWDLDASDIAEANAQAWAEAGSPRDAAGAPALPVRTPGAAWDLIESEIWAGTNLVEPMRRSRLSRRGKKALERAFREGCCGRADHERWCRTWRPITKRHAARMGIDRKDAVLLRPKFADLLAVRVGK